MYSCFYLWNIINRYFVFDEAIRWFIFLVSRCSDIYIYLKYYKLKGVIYWYFFKKIVICCFVFFYVVIIVIEFSESVR